MFGLYLDMEFTSANPAKCSGRILHGDGLLSDPIALDVTALRPETRTEGLVVKLVGLGPMAASRRDSWKRPCWRRPGRTPGRCRPPTSPSTGPSPEKTSRPKPPFPNPDCARRSRRRRDSSTCPIQSRSTLLRDLSRRTSAWQAFPLSRSAPARIPIGGGAA